MIDRIRVGVCLGMLAGWLFTIVAPAFIDGYEPNLAVNGPLLFVLAWLFPPAKIPVLRRRSNPPPVQQPNGDK